MPSLIHIADRLLNRPLLITPDKAAVITSVLAGRIGIDAAALAPDASRFVGDSIERDATGRAIASLPYRRTEGGVGILTITGSLVNRGAWIGASSGLTSYEGIQHQLAALKADPKVASVILDISSPGGEAIGAFETAAAVRDLAKSKRTVAVVNGIAASAAYAIASGATEIVTIETGVSGSIGVVMVHGDFSRQLENEGVKVTLIYAGAHKVDGNPFGPLPDAVKEDLKAEIDAFYNKFLKTVAAGRGARLTVDAARATEARTMIGEAAVKVGLADRVGTFDSVLSELSKSARLAGRSIPVSNKGATMSNEPTNPAAESDSGIPRAAHEAAVANARADGRREGETTAHTRLSAILGHEKIAGNAARMTAALKIATNAPTMSAADVANLVAETVPDQASAASAGFASRAAENPANNIGAGNAQPEKDDAKPKSKINAAAIYAERRKAFNQQ